MTKKGYVQSSEHKAKKAQALRGRHFSLEHRQKLKENHVGFTGKHLNEKQKAAINKTGFKHSEESKIKMRESHLGKNTGEDHALWKGDEVGYHALHHWVTRNKGNPRKCELCGTLQAKKYEWASKTHEYKRDLDEFIRLCTSCHRKYDIRNNNYKTYT